MKFKGILYLQKKSFQTKVMQHAKRRIYPMYFVHNYMYKTHAVVENTYYSCDVDLWKLDSLDCNTLHTAQGKQQESDSSDTWMWACRLVEPQSLYTFLTFLFYCCQECHFRNCFYIVKVCTRMSGRLPPDTPVYFEWKSFKSATKNSWFWDEMMAVSRFKHGLIWKKCI